MRLSPLRGVIPAHITPFFAYGQLDEVALRDHVLALINTPGVTALVSNSPTGEAEALSRNERCRVLELVAETVNGHVPVLAGLVVESENEGVIQAQDAQKAGASGLIIYPLQARKMQPGFMLKTYLDRLAETTQLPLVLAQVSIAPHPDYTNTTLLDACQHYAVIAFAEGSGIIAQYEMYLRAAAHFEHPVSILAAADTALLSALVLGGDGVLSGISSVAAHLHAALLDTLERSHLPGARAINDQLWPLTQVFCSTPHTGPVSLIKIALYQLGLLPTPTTRLPGSIVSERDTARVEQALIQARLLKR